MEIIEQIVSTLHEFVAYSGYWGFFLLSVIESTSIPVILPAEAIILSAGYLVGEGQLDFTITAIVCTVGSVCGASINYVVAYYFGRPLLFKYGKYILITQKSIIKFEAIFKEHDILVTFFGRFLPLVKHICSIPPGLSRMNPIKFLFATTAGAGIFTVGVLFAGLKLGESAAKDFNKLKPILEIGLLVFIVLSVVIYLIYNRITSNALTKENKK